MNEKLAIKLKVLERTYPLRIEWNEEEKLREAAKRINDLVLRFKEHYADKDNQDLLTMACLQFASKVLDLETKQEQNNVEKHIDALCEDLDEFLKLNQ
ncbi:MAG: cell division protein ZapA [Bacteroidales bacterium]|nr:cell division protein ZapA [Bacteroidales bacterium]NLK82384.1 cell division protein ZapA [Bacteroidales bacterium]